MNTSQERAWLLGRGYSERFNSRVEDMSPAQVHAIFMRLRMMPEEARTPQPEAPSAKEFTEPFTRPFTQSYTQPTLF